MAKTLREEIQYLDMEMKSRILTYPNHRDVESWKGMSADLSNALSLPDTTPVEATRTVWVVDYGKGEPHTVHESLEAAQRYIEGLDLDYFGQPVRWSGDFGPWIEGRYYSHAHTTKCLWAKPLEVLT